LDDALRAAIELHDLPAPDDAKTSPYVGGGCPVPSAGSIGEIDYGTRPSAVVCPSYESRVSADHRGEARVSIARFRALSPYDQGALVEFLEQL
jgi:hypothetical protein